MLANVEFTPRIAHAFAIVAFVAFVGALAPIGSASAHEPDAEEVALGSLVDAELAFARASANDGVRAAFVANFAPDGIALQPAPVRIAEAWRDAERDTHARRLRLVWTPAQAGVAHSHDFGYTTGPYSVTRAGDAKATRHGVFFSVWQRNAKGQWKVLLDAGTSVPSPGDFAALGAAPRPVAAMPAARRRDGIVQSARARLLADEASAFGASAGGLTPTTYAKLLRDDVRLHRNGSSPLATRAKVAREIALHVRRVVWMPEDARIARSNDMAVTYGRYRETDRDDTVRDGYYAHLWMRDRDGAWRLAYDVALPGRP
jgi:ketosteroid isomerase-like protein